MLSLAVREHEGRDFPQFFGGSARSFDIGILVKVAVFKQPRLPKSPPSFERGECLAEGGH